MPTLLNLVPNSAKVIATSGAAAIRLILRVRLRPSGASQSLRGTWTLIPVVLFQHTHYPRLIPIITSNCGSKSVAVRR